jgi:hypothetical protein
MRHVGQLLRQCCHLAGQLLVAAGGCFLLRHLRAWARLCPLPCVSRGRTTQASLPTSQSNMRLPAVKLFMVAIQPGQGAITQGRRQLPRTPHRRVYVDRTACVGCFDACQLADMGLDACMLLHKSGGLERLAPRAYTFGQLGVSAGRILLAASAARRVEGSRQCLSCTPQLPPSSLPCIARCMQQRTPLAEAASCVQLSHVWPGTLVPLEPPVQHAWFRRRTMPSCVRTAAHAVHPKLLHNDTHPEAQAPPQSFMHAGVVQVAGGAGFHVHEEAQQQLHTSNLCGQHGQPAAKACRCRLHACLPACIAAKTVTELSHLSTVHLLGMSNCRQLQQQQQQASSHGGQEPVPAGGRT